MQTQATTNPQRVN